MNQKQTQKNLFVKGSAKMLIFTLFVCGSMSISPEETRAFVSDITSANIISLTNIERSGAGLTRLEESKTLNQAAQMKLDHMIENDYFSHNSPDGTTPWYWFETAQYDYQHAGENLAMDFDYAANQHKAWMNSVTHRQNIMSPKYTQIGVATGTGKINGETTTLTVQVFGTPINGTPVKGVSTENQKLNEQTVMAPVPESFQEVPTQTSLPLVPQQTLGQPQNSDALPFDSKTVGYIAWTIIITATLFALVFDSVMLYRIHMRQKEKELDTPSAQI